MKNRVLLLVLASLAAIAAIVWVFRPDNYLLNNNVKLTALQSGSEISWVTVANDKPIESHNNLFKAGDTCVVSYLGQFAVAARRPNVTMIWYANPDGKQGAGSQCPNGTQFALDIDQASLLFVKVKKFKDERRAEINLVSDMANRTNPPKGKFRPAKPFGWVRVLNDPYVNNGNGRFEFGQSCSLLDKTGPFYVLGVYDTDTSQILVRYDGPQGLGAECGTGTLFWATGEK